MDAPSWAESARCMLSGQPGIVGLRGSCDAIRGFKAAVPHATWEELSRLRATYWREYLDKRIRDAEQIGVGHIPQSLDWAGARRAAWSRVEFDDGARNDALLDLAGMGR